MSLTTDRRSRPREVIVSGGEGDPRPARPPRHRLTPIIPRGLHVQWCRWPHQAPDAYRPELAHCAGCGLYVQS